MSVKIIIVTADDKTHQIGGNWMTIDDAAGDVNGGDFWSDVGDKFPAGVNLGLIFAWHTRIASRWMKIKSFELAKTFHEYLDSSFLPEFKSLFARKPVVNRYIHSTI